MAYKERYAGRINRKLNKKLHVVEVAAGREKADLVLKNATYVNAVSYTHLDVYTRQMKLKAEAVDVTIPGKAVKIGKKHPMYQVLDEIKDIFVGMGFEILEDREVETADYNFTKLNCLEGHPAREWTDTFYFTEDSSILLRTQTSPMQIHAMETRSLPIRILAPGLSLIHI